MRIIGYELKKLLNWKIITLMVMVSALFYQLFLVFYIDQFPNGRPNLDYYNVAKDMITEYGHDIDEREYTDFQQTYKEEVEKANEYLQSKESFVEAGITSYDQFINIERDNQELTQLQDQVFFEEEMDVFWELQAREGMIEQYQGRTDLALESENESQQGRVQEVLRNNEREAILPTEVVENYNALITQWAVLIVLSVMMVISRVHIMDKNNNMRTLQYTTYKGRGLFKAKAIASFLATFLITSVHLGVFFVLHSSNHVSMFFNSSLHSFLHYAFYWLDFRFFDYIVVTVIGVFLLAFVTAALSIVISSFISRYITLLGTHVPVAIILILLISEYLISHMMSIRYPLMLTVSTYVLLIILGMVLLVTRWKKERKVDIA